MTDSFASEKLTLEKKQNHHGFVIKEKANFFLLKMNEPQFKHEDGQKYGSHALSVTSMV